VERSYTDYYAIEYITEYYPQMIPETKIEYVPVERVENRIEYYPVERQVVHYPDEMLSGSRRALGISSVPQSVTVGTSIPTIGLSRVASSGLIGTTGLSHRTSKLGQTFPYGMRPTSSYNPTGMGISTGNTYNLMSNGSFGMVPSSSYGISPENGGYIQQTVVTETNNPPSTFNNGVNIGGRYFSSDGGYFATNNSPSVT
jgi:hypothetical protein